MLSKSAVAKNNCAISNAPFSEKRICLALNYYLSKYQIPADLSSQILGYYEKMQNRHFWPLTKNNFLNKRGIRGDFLIQDLYQFETSNFIGVWLRHDLSLSLFISVLFPNESGPLLLLRLLLNGVRFLPSIKPRPCLRPCRPFRVRHGHIICQNRQLIWR